MKEQHYRLIGWGFLVLSLLIAGQWCFNQTGLAGLLMRTSQRLLDTELRQISFLITFAIVVFPGYVIKRYFDSLAWNAHLESLPPPDIHESARRSKYVKTDGLPPVPPKPVQLSDLPKEQMEFIATCPACGHFFPATKDSKDLRCPNCGESLPLTK